MEWTGRALGRVFVGNHSLSVPLLLREVLQTRHPAEKSRDQSSLVPEADSHRKDETLRGQCAFPIWVNRRRQLPPSLFAVCINAKPLCFKRPKHLPPIHNPVTAPLPPFRALLSQCLGFRGSTHSRCLPQRDALRYTSTD